MRMFKFAFLGVKGRLCGFHSQKLAMEISKADDRRLDAKGLWSKMLRAVHDYSQQLRIVVQEAVNDSEEEHEKQEQLERQIDKMRNVLADADIF